MSDEEIKSKYVWIKRSYHYSKEVLDKRASIKESKILLDSAPLILQNKKSKSRI